MVAVWRGDAEVMMKMLVLVVNGDDEGDVTGADGIEC